MPLKRCTEKGKPGWKWGNSGKCFTGSDAKQKAIAQGVAIGDFTVDEGIIYKEEVSDSFGITKVDEEKQIVYGEVYAPFTIDTQGEMMTADALEKMAHSFIKKSLDGAIDTMHNNLPNGSFIVESFIARRGDPDFIEGAWVVAVKIEDDELWAQVKKGELNGFSFEGDVRKIKALVEVEVFSHVVGYVEKAEGGHDHAFFVSVGDDGQVTGGITSTDGGHFHVIKRGTATEEEDKHAHRYFQ